MQSLNAQLSRRIDETVAPLIAGRSERICIIDPPGYANVGDSAIFLGELAFLRRNFPDAKIDFFDTVNYTPACDRFIEDSSIILLQGGGNFGEIWPRHHAIRMEILKRFPGKPIVQFPQSLSFTTEAGIDATARAIERQGNFTLLVRDRNSQAFAEKHFPCTTVLCPDMAFALGDIAREPASLDFLCLLRQDKEVVTDHSKLLQVLAELGGSLDVADWIEAPDFAAGAARHGAGPDLAAVPVDHRPDAVVRLPPARALCARAAGLRAWPAQPRIDGDHRPAARACAVLPARRPAPAVRFPGRQGVRALRGLDQRYYQRPACQLGG